jgi:hypothetical protein
MPTLGHHEPGELRSDVLSSLPPSSTGLYAYSLEQHWSLVQQSLVGQIDSLPLGAPVDGSGLPRVEPSPCDTYHDQHPEEYGKADLYPHSSEWVSMGQSLGPSSFEAPDDGSSPFHRLPRGDIPIRATFSGGNTDFMTDFPVPSASGE